MRSYNLRFYFKFKEFELRSQQCIMNGNGVWGLFPVPKSIEVGLLCVLSLGSKDLFIMYH